MKRALVLPGGANKGAFQLGVLLGWVEQFKAADRLEEFDYEYIGGTSTGALSAGMVAQSPKGEFHVGVQKLDDIYEDISGDRDIWKHWFIPYVPGLLWRDGFFNTKPLHKLARKHFSQANIVEHGREVRVSAVNLDTGEYLEVDQDTPELLRWILASSAFPGFFLPINIDGAYYTDGGVRRITPLKGAIEWGAEEIDVLLTGPLKTRQKTFKEGSMGTKVNALKVLLRSIDLLTHELFTRDVKICGMYNEHVRFNISDGKREVKLNIIEPADYLNDDSLDFDPNLLDEMKEAGFNATRGVLHPRLR